MSSSTTSKRKWAPKRTSGCKTCKTRRVKCDDRLPTCGPCQKSHRQCSYVPLDVTEQDPLKIVLWQPANTALHQSLNPNSSYTHQELRALDFFRTTVAVKLGGFFDSPFWTHEILQVAQQEVPVCHAIVALSSLCEGFLENDKASQSSQGSSKTLALQQQSKAISNLRLKMEEDTESKASTEIVLTTCILLICFEMFQNNHESALSHMSSGIYVFYNWQFKSGAVAVANQQEGLTQQLRYIFGRLMLQTILFVDTRPQQWRFIAPAFTPPLKDIPRVFSSIDEARDCLNDCMCSMYHKILISQFHPMENIPLQDLPIESSPQAGVGPLEEWLVSFAFFFQQQNHRLSLEEHRGVALLKMQHATASILAVSGTLGGEIVFDTFEDTFKNILDWASSILTVNAEESVEWPPFPSFEMGILPHLYFTASRCRHRLIRRQALQLLRQGPKQEGIWHKNMLINIAERIVQIEEFEVEESMIIPGTARLTVINASINSTEREVTLHCCRQQFKGEAIDVIHELVKY